MDVGLLEREDAMESLISCLEAATRGQGLVAVVAGEPGIGKSALVDAFAAVATSGRVLTGACDDLLIPRPLGPLHDMAPHVSGDLRRALADDAAPELLHRLVLDELDTPPRPVVMVIEDLHWADDATLDLVTVVARRIERLGALLVLTYRSAEADRRLHNVLGQLPPHATRHIDLQPLSIGAVESIVGDEAERVFAITAGNPFYVTELVADREDLPPTVSQAVLARLARLPEPTRRLLDLISVVPARLEIALLDRIVPDWMDHAEIAEERRMIEVDHAYVRFRHELARTAVEANLTSMRRRALNRLVLDGLLGWDGAVPTRIVHHAEQVNDLDVLAEYAIRAARRAAGAGARLQAFAHYRRAADFCDGMEPAEAASLHEELAEIAYVTDHLAEALAAAGVALAGYRELGDVPSEGRTLRLLSRLQWVNGEGKLAREYGAAAVAVLEPLGPSTELAMAYSNRSQLAMLAGDVAATERWGGRAIELAETLGDEHTRAHALVNVGTVRLHVDSSDHDTCLLAFDVASAAGAHHEAVRAVQNLGYELLESLQLDEAEHYIDRAAAYAEAHEVHLLLSYIVAMRSRLLLLTGRWDEAEIEVDWAHRRSNMVSRLLAAMVGAHLQVRRGDSGAGVAVSEVAALAARTEESQRLGPAAAIAAEHSWLRGERIDVAPLAHIAEHRQLGAGGTIDWVMAWLAIAGETPPGPPSGSPWGLLAQGRADDARTEFARRRMPYETALASWWSDSPDVLAEAVATADALGAVPLAGRLRERMRASGMAVPGRRRTTTLANPAGLTTRQMDVLALVAEGLTNADIADTLYLSPRTVEHHVAAILTKLEATSRSEAATIAAGQGLLATGTGRD